MSGGTSEDCYKNKTLRINAVGTVRGGQGRFGICGDFGGCGGRGSGGHGHGRGRGIPCTPYRPPSANINITIEARQYLFEKIRHVSPHQKFQVQQMKIAARWIN